MPKPLIEVSEDDIKKLREDIAADLRDILDKVHYREVNDPYVLQRTTFMHMGDKIDMLIDARLAKYTTELKVGAHITEILKLIKT